MDEMTFGQRLKAMRDARGWTQFELSMRTKGVVQPASISRWEADQRRPLVDAAVALADAFGCTLDELLGRVATGAYLPHAA